jgi:hypothetical protein
MWPPLIFQKLGIKHDSPKHSRACSTQGLLSPKELARAGKGPTCLFPAEQTEIRPEAVSHCQVLLDSGSGGDLMFHEKGKPMHFPYLTR